MRHVAKRKKPKLNSFTNKNKLLHSIIKGKSTYFYSNDGELSDSKSSNHNFTSGLRVRLSSLRENSESPEVPSAILTRRSPNSKSPYSKITGWRTSYILPVACSLALLLVLGVMINPFARSGEEVYAAYEPVTSTTGVSLLMETSDALEQQTQVANGVTAYRYNRFKVNKGTDIDKYQVLVQAANGYDSTLVGAENGQTVSAVADATKGSAMDSAWGYSLAEGAITNTDSLANLDYQALPGSGSTNTNATPYTETKEFTLAFAANIKDKPADHYQTNVLLSVAAGATEVATLYTVNYDGNGGSNVPNAQMETSLHANYSARIPSDAIPIRPDYSFRGWATSDTASTATYEPGENIILKSTSPTTTLYAVWKPVTNKLITLSNMQDTNLATACADTTTPSKWDTVSGVPMARLADSRDSKEYWVAKLADGNCWMVQNLALDLQGRTLGSNDSDVSSSWSGATNVASELWGVIDSTDVKWYHSDEGSGLSSHGNYYSYQAATAGEAPSNGGDAWGSICPRGWRLPYSNTTISKSSYYLLNQYGLTKSPINSITGQRIDSAPLYLVYSGYVSNNTLKDVDSGAYYWLSWTGGPKNATALWSSLIDVSYSYTTYRDFGYTIRCVAK